MRCLKVAGSSCSAVVASPSPPPALCGCCAAHGQRAGTFTPGSHCLVGTQGPGPARVRSLLPSGRVSTALQAAQGRQQRHFRLTGYTQMLFPEAPTGCQCTEKRLSLEESFKGTIPVDQTSPMQTNPGVWVKTNTQAASSFHCSRTNPRPPPPHCPVPPQFSTLSGFHCPVSWRLITTIWPLVHHWATAAASHQAHEHEGDKADPKLNTEQVKQSKFPHLTLSNISF